MKAAAASGQSLESFILAAADAEAERIQSRQVDKADWHATIDELLIAVDHLDRVETVAPDVPVDQEGTRRGPRHPIEGLQLLNPVHGRVVDMSRQGLGVETWRPFSVPERSTFSIGRSVASAKIRAEVRWCLLVRTERVDNGDIVPVYRSGLAFLGNN